MGRGSAHRHDVVADRELARSKGRVVVVLRAHDVHVDLVVLRGTQHRLGGAALAQGALGAHVLQQVDEVVGVKVGGLREGRRNKKIRGMIRGQGVRGGENSFHAVFTEP